MEKNLPSHDIIKGNCVEEFEILIEVTFYGKNMKLKSSLSHHKNHSDCGIIVMYKLDQLNLFPVTLSPHSEGSYKIHIPINSGDYS